MDLKDKAAIWLEEMYISGDTQINIDHNLDELPEEQQSGCYDLCDILSGFVEHVRGQETSNEKSTLPIQNVVARLLNDKAKEHKKPTDDLLLGMCDGDLCLYEYNENDEEFHDLETLW